MNWIRRYAPVVVLFLLSPFIAEFLYGATPASNLPAIIPSLAVYGGGVVLIRELARRWGSPVWVRIVLLGAAYGIVEEGLGLQSMFNPDLFHAAAYGGRLFGVNWVWSEWTVGYHIVWSIAIPILLAELLFPDRRYQPWLGRAGLGVVGVLYALGVAAYMAIFRLMVAPGFEAAPVLTLGAALLVVVLVVLARSWPVAPAGSAPPSAPPVPSPWLAGFMALAMGGVWFGLLALPMRLRTGLLVLVPMLLELALAGGWAALIRHWSAMRRWGNLHTLALVVGGTAVIMLIGFFAITTTQLDQIVQGLASLITLLLLALFARRLYQRAHFTQAGTP